MQQQFLRTDWAKGIQKQRTAYHQENRNAPPRRSIQDVEQHPCRVVQIQTAPILRGNVEQHHSGNGKDTQAVQIEDPLRFPGSIGNFVCHSVFFLTTCFSYRDR